MRHLELGPKKEPKPKLFGPHIFQWGRVLPRERVGAKKFDTSLEPREIKVFGAGYPGILPGYPGGAREVWEKKTFVFNFRSLFGSWNASGLRLDFEKSCLPHLYDHSPYILDRERGALGVVLPTFRRSRNNLCVFVLHDLLTLWPEKITNIFLFSEFISRKITFQLYKHIFLGLISRKLHYTYSFVIQRITCKNCLGIMFLEDHVSVTQLNGLGIDLATISDLSVTLTKLD